MISPGQRKALVAELLQQHEYDTLIQLLRDSQDSLQKSVTDFPTDAESTLESILFYVERHVQFLKRYSIDAEPQYDDQGTFHNRYDDFLTVWLQLDASGLSDTVLMQHIKTRE